MQVGQQVLLGVGLDWRARVLMWTASWGQVDTREQAPSPPGLSQAGLAGLAGIWVWKQRWPKTLGEKEASGFDGVDSLFDRVGSGMGRVSSRASSWQHRERYGQSSALDRRVAVPFQLIV